MKSLEDYRKRYVAVYALEDVQGNTIPKAIKWNDYKVYKIDDVVAQRDKSPYETLYTIKVKGKTTTLWNEANRWYVYERHAYTKL